MKQLTAISVFSKFYSNVLKQLGIKKETPAPTIELPVTPPTSTEPIQEEQLPKDEVSYLYGFKMIIKNDKVGKALVMSLPSRENKSKN